MKNFTLSLLFVSICSISSFGGTLHSNFFGAANIVLKKLSGYTDGQVTTIYWELTEMEQEVTCFLERSEDGLVFARVAGFTIKKGFAGSMRATDNPANTGLYYYRLNITKEGYIPYISSILTIQIDRKDMPVNELKVENPFRHQVTIKGDFGAKPIKVEIADVNGRIRIVKNIAAGTKRESISISSDTIGKGVYVVRINEEHNGAWKIIMTKRIIKNID